MTLQEALRALLPLARPNGFENESLGQRLAGGAASAPASRALGRVLGEAMVAGQLTTAAWLEATSSPAPGDFIAAWGPLFDALIRAGVADSIDGFPDGWSQETLRLWGYTEGWLITSEDEDLALTTDELVPALLELATDQACPKRDYVLGIVRSWARRRASLAAGNEAFGDVVTHLANYAPLALRANDASLADYLVRLGSYAASKPVDRDGAYQRGLDLARWHEPKPEDVRVELDCGSWRVETFASLTLRIRQADGRIF